MMSINERTPHNFLPRTAETLGRVVVVSCTPVGNRDELVNLQARAYFTLASVSLHTSKTRPALFVGT